MTIDFVFISNGVYSKKEILRMEKSILNCLEFQLTCPTSLKHAQVWWAVAGQDIDCKSRMISEYVMELLLVSYAMLKHQGSVLAAAALSVAVLVMRYDANAQLQHVQNYSDYSDLDVRECKEMIVQLIKTGSTGRFTAVYRKYSKIQFLKVAKIAEVHFCSK